jgi:hypothetical protein
MRKISAVLLLVVPTVVSVQAQSYGKRQPVVVPPGYFASLNSTPKHMATNRLSATTNAAAQAGSPRIVSLPNFTGSFSYGGQGYSYTMAGRAPGANQTTVIPTTYLPLSLYFDEFVDQNGNNITIDATTVTKEITRSPLFENAEYATGTTQFVDAQMRAEFWPQLRNGRNDNFHVLVSPPQPLTPVTIEVPVGSSEVYQLPDGSYFALIDFNFLISQLNTLFQTEPITVNSIPIFLTRNAVFGDFVSQAPVDCCIGGFHTAFETNQIGNRVFVQTAIFATSLDPDVADGIFQDPAVFSDINALSHEVAETLNDPFINNVTPAYQLPGAPSGTCQNDLEVGDVIENLMPDYTEVSLHGYTYHPQTLGLLQWFEGIQPSNAFGGAYSFPDTTKLTTPFVPCGIQPVG